MNTDLVFDERILESDHEFWKPSRHRVLEIENALFELPQLDLPVTHHFSQGKIYARELFIPAGVLLTGHIHKYEQLNILSQGEVSVLTEQVMIRVKASFTIVAPSGTKRIIYAHEDSVWTVIHGTEETDVEVIESYFIAHTQDEFERFLRHHTMKEIT